MKNPAFELPYMGLKIYSKNHTKFPSIVQPKLDGLDARLWNNKFYSRGRKVWNDSVVIHILDHLRYIGPVEDTMFHGQFYCHGKPLGWHTSNINVNLTEPTSETKEVKFIIYDFWKPNCKLNFMQRQQALASSFDRGDVAINAIVQSHEQIANLYEAALINDYEGIVICAANGSYVNAKSWLKMKLKKDITEDFQVIGAERGTGKYLKMLGKLICLTTDRLKTFKVGTGFTDLQRKEFFKEEFWNSTKVSRFITVKYNELSEDGIPLNPVFLSVRDYE